MTWRRTRTSSPQTLNGFDKWSKAFAAAESHGPYLSFSGDLTIQGSVQAVAAALGVPGSSQLVEQGLGPEFFNPATYTAADCPTYQGESGPNCPVPSPRCVDDGWLGARRPAPTA